MLKKIDVYIGAVILIIIDQATKVLVANSMVGKSITIIKNILNFTYCENKGVAFSLGSGNVATFIVVNLFIICGLVYYYIKNFKQFNGLKKVFFTMVIAGGTSNLIDRIIRGYVVDFIDITAAFNFAIFNIADIYVVIGIVGLSIKIISEMIYNNKNV